MDTTAPTLGSETFVLAQTRRAAEALVNTRPAQTEPLARVQATLRALVARVSVFFYQNVQLVPPGSDPLESCGCIGMSLKLA
jgi:hypothetical protein